MKSMPKKKKFDVAKEIYKAFEAEAHVKEIVSVVPLFGNSFRVNIREDVFDVVKRSFFIRANEESGVYYSNPPLN